MKPLSIETVTESKHLYNMSYLLMFGLLDSLSFHRTFPTLVNNSKVTKLVLQIVLANVFLLIGSIFMYERGIKPGLLMLNSSLIPPERTQRTDQDIVLFAAYTVYHILWIVPVYGLCYACSVSWYKDLSTSLLTKPAKQLKNAVQDSIYSNLVWLFIWIQGQLFYNIIPICLNSIPTGSNTGLSSIILSQTITVTSFISKSMGFLLNCALYGWYSFDPRWMSEGYEGDLRFSQVENYILYFIGFGLPYALLFKYVSFFAAYGVYMSLFPFCMILGSISNYKEKIEGAIYQMHVFSYPRVITHEVLKRFRGKAAENLKKSYGSSTSGKKSKSS